MDNCYTVSCDYFATGEGITYMILFTRDEEPLERFKEIFNEYYAQGAEVSEGLDFNSHAADKLIPQHLRETIEICINQGGNFEYHASLHFNLS